MLFLGLSGVQYILVSLGLDLSYGSSFVVCGDKFVGVWLASSTHIVIS